MESRKKLLLIDDDEAVLSLLVTRLASRYDLFSTTDPRQAVALAKAEQPDVVLCDIDRPGMCGGDVAAALNAEPETAFIPVVYLTALVSPEETRELGGDVGGRPGVSKRASLGELVRVVEAVLAR
jgi:putative two-component system response regulator